MKPYISFLIAYIFCQTTPVEGKDLLLRIVGLTLGGIATSISYLLSRRKESFKPYAFAKQVQSGFIQYKFVFRMTVGIACAMLLAALLHLQKPLWISIVVMSLTQLEIKDTIERIHHRTIATVFGVILFVLLFRVLIPPEYDVLLILFSGYLSTFLSQYKYKQIINAISAINASLVLMDTSTAVINRFLCLLVGIAIVLGLFLLEKTATQYHHKIQLRN
ncbi:MAG: FUSC family protein [Lachnospiraceae bacterium]